MWGTPAAGRFRRCRSRTSYVLDMPGYAADRRVHQEDVSDGPDPVAPPDPLFARGLTLARGNPHQSADRRHRTPRAARRPSAGTLSNTPNSAQLTVAVDVRDSHIGPHCSLSVPHPPGLPTVRPARRSSWAAVAPAPTRLFSRAKGPPRLLDRLRLIFLSPWCANSRSIARGRPRRVAGRRAARKHDDIFLVAPYRYATSHPRERLLKRIGLVFGLISGVMLSAMLVSSMALGVQMGVGGMIVGYTTMLIASLLVYFGIRSYRDNVGSGSVGFGRALQIGLSISLISTVCYVVRWEIVYRTMMPDFAEKYSAATVKSEREKGSAPERIAKVEQSMAEFRAEYAKP